MSLPSPSSVISAGRRGCRSRCPAAAASAQRTAAWRKHRRLSRGSALWPGSSLLSCFQSEVIAWGFPCSLLGQNCPERRPLVLLCRHQKLNLPKKAWAVQLSAAVWLRLGRCPSRCWSGSSRSASPPWLEPPGWGAAGSAAPTLPCWSRLFAKTTWRFSSLQTNRRNPRGIGKVCEGKSSYQRFVASSRSRLQSPGGLNVWS